MSIRAMNWIANGNGTLRELRSRSEDGVAYVIQTARDREAFRAYSSNDHGGLTLLGVTATVGLAEHCVLYDVMSRESRAYHDPDVVICAHATMGCYRKGRDPSELFVPLEWTHHTNKAYRPAAQARTPEGGSYVIALDNQGKLRVDYRNGGPRPQLVASLPLTCWGLAEHCVAEHYLSHR